MDEQNQEKKPDIVINWPELKKKLRLIFEITIMMLLASCLISIYGYEKQFSFNCKAVETIMLHYKVIQSGRRTIIIYNPANSDMIETDEENFNKFLNKKR